MSYFRTIAVYGIHSSFHDFPMYMYKPNRELYSLMKDIYWQAKGNPTLPPPSKGIFRVARLHGISKGSTWGQIAISLVVKKVRFHTRLGIFLQCILLKSSTSKIMLESSRCFVATG